MTDPAARLRAFRHRLGLTQAQAARLTDTPQRTWEGYEGEGRKVPGPLLKLCDYIERFGPIPEAPGTAESPQEGAQRVERLGV